MGEVVRLTGPELRRVELGSYVNEGARLAWLELEERGWDQATLRAALGKVCGAPVHSGALTKYLYCDRRPGVVWAARFKTVLGIEPEAWHRPPTEPFSPPAARDAAPLGKLSLRIAEIEIEGDSAAVTEGVVALFEALKNALSKGGR
jgi:hypothetical protein